jgi:hypothetical protein
MIEERYEYILNTLKLAHIIDQNSGQKFAYLIINDYLDVL